MSGNTHDTDAVFYPPPMPPSLSKRRQRIRTWAPCFAGILVGLLLPLLSSPETIPIVLNALAQPTSLFFLAIALLVVFAVWFLNHVLHEIGHALAAHLVGMQVLAIQLGPVHMRHTETGWSFRWASQVPGIGGLTWALGNSDSPHFRRDRILFVLGGACANLALAGILFTATSFLALPPLVHGTLLLAVIISAALGLSNLIPFHINGWRSDGRIIFDLWRYPRNLPRLKQIDRLLASAQNGVRPRDWPLETLPAAVDDPSDGEAIQVTLLRLTYALDARDASMAHACLTWLVPYFWRFPEGLRQSLAVNFAAYAVLIARDPSLLAQWRPLCDGGIMEISAQRHWLDAENAMFLEDWDAAKAHSRQARRRLPDVPDKASAAFLEEVLDELDDRLTAT